MYTLGANSLTNSCSLHKLLMTLVSSFYLVVGMEVFVPIFFFKRQSSRNRGTDVENKCMDTKGGKWWGRGEWW